MASAFGCGSSTHAMEDELLRVIARMDGTPFPSTMALAGRWVRGRLRQPAPLESTYCAEVVAVIYQAMGLLADNRPANFYDPGSFWSGDKLILTGGATLGAEISVAAPAADPGVTPLRRVRPSRGH